MVTHEHEIWVSIAHPSRQHYLFIAEFSYVYIIQSLAISLIGRHHCLHTPLTRQWNINAIGLISVALYARWRHWKCGYTQLEAATINHRCTGRYKITIKRLSLELSMNIPFRPLAGVWLSTIACQVVRHIVAFILLYGIHTHKTEIFHGWHSTSCLPSNGGWLINALLFC